MIEALQTALTLIGVPIARSVAGWLNNSLEDGKIDMIEWKLLGSTIVRVGLIGTATYFGFNGLGIDISAVGASFGAILMDKLFEAMKNAKKK